MIWIKICGITNLKDALEASSLGVDALGFLFAPSPRRISCQDAREIITNLPASVMKFGVFVNEEAEVVRKVAEYCGLNGIQFHGQESPEYCRGFSLPVIKAVGVKGQESLRGIDKYPFASILLDSFAPEKPGGSGKTFIWEMALETRKKRNFILSGGLTPWNVAQAVHLLRPQGVDVCSGVERTPGKKDLVKMMEFVKEVKKADETSR